MAFFMSNGILHVLDFYVWKHVQYHTTYQVTIVTQFPYIVGLEHDTTTLCVAGYQPEAAQTFQYAPVLPPYVKSARRY